MGPHRQLLDKLKIDLLDLCLNGIKKRSYFEWYELVINKFKNHFHINEYDFFIYNKDLNAFLSIDFYNKMDASKAISRLDYKLIIDNPPNEVIQSIHTVGYTYVDDFVLFNTEQSEPMALLLMASSPTWEKFAKSDEVNGLKKVISELMRSVQQLNNLLNEGEKFRILYNITESFTSTMTSESILDQMLQTVKMILPKAKKTLILSREHPGMTYKYKIFNQEKSNTHIITSFLNGTVTTEINENQQITTMNTPVKGRQGVYGVLRITVSEEKHFTSTQRTLIQMLVNTAGNALENASLYRQSFQLNEDLRLINETAQKLNSGLTLKEMLAYLKSQIMKILSADEVYFIIGSKENYELMETSYQFFLNKQKTEYTRFISNYIYEEKKPLFNANFHTESFEHPIYKSMIGIPILNQEEVIGAVICLQEQEYSFSFNSFKLIESLIIHASLSISNLQLREKMRELAEKDYLTGLFSRRYVEKHIHSMIESQEGGTFLLFDIDDFKLINDQYGHDIGDRVLAQVGNCLLNEKKDGIISGRWGGEEFAMYFPDSYGAETERIARHLLEIIPTKTNPSVTVSMGLVRWQPNVPCNFESLFKKVDHLLYLAKEQGKNRLLIGSKSAH